MATGRSLLLAVLAALFVVPALKLGFRCSEGGALVEHAAPLHFDAALAKRVDVILSLEASHLTPVQRVVIRDEVVSAALEYDVDPLFILALMSRESSFRPRAISPKGALGLLQLLPTTARWFAERFGRPWEATGSLFDPRANIRLGVEYFAYLHRKFGDVALSLAAYNRGPAAAARKFDADGARADAYPQRVLEEYRRYRALAACESSACTTDAPWAVRTDSADSAGACLDAASSC